jgi:threonine dehydrogenase-like Zn-dependent dehydrogenase
MKAGVIGIIGVFPPQAMTFPIGTLQQRNLTVRGGNCNHRKYMPRLVDLVATGALDPTKILTQTEPITGAIEAYEVFDRRQSRLDQGGAQPRRLAATPQANL